jgi:electron transfer flavoprotein alpha subunit
VSVVVGTWGVGRGGGAPSGSTELLTLGRALATTLGTELRWLVIGPPPADAAAVGGQHGVDAIDRLTDDRLAAFGADSYVAALARYAAVVPFRVLLVPQTFDARLVAPRLAARLDAGVVMNGLAVDADGGRLTVTASAFGGDTRVVYELAAAERWVIGIATAGLAVRTAEPPTTPTTRTVPVALDDVTERVRVVTKSEATGPRIEDADVIVAGGRGLGAKENYALIEELATALGGMAGASRPIVDEGWAEPARQVGLTGKITRPSLYVAAGISGASQHMVGCAAAKTLVAINRDPDAAIFRYARYGIVGDCLAVLPALVRALKGQIR